MILQNPLFLRLFAVCIACCLAAALSSDTATGKAVRFVCGVVTVSVIGSFFFSASDFLGTPPAASVEQAVPAGADSDFPGTLAEKTMALAENELSERIYAFCGIKPDSVRIQYTVSTDGQSPQVMLDDVHVSFSDAPQDVSSLLSSLAEWLPGCHTTLSSGVQDHENNG